ncbi:cora-domain-containing protein [Imleria badia]|nr:cora-domain-containing protein [Imleria badia]
MALHLSRARRETIVHPTSPFDGPRTGPEPPFESFSAVERHDFQLARGEEPHVLDHDIIPGGHVIAPGSAVAQDPSLLVSIEGQYSLPIHPDPSSSIPGLPRYQLSSPRSVFDFAPLEGFAAEEKESLGLTPSGPPMMRIRHPKERRDEGQQSTSSPLTGSGVFDLSGGATAMPKRPGARQRKLSESAPLPRPHRRNGRGKLALFENQANEQVSGIPARFMGAGQLSAVPSSEDVSGMFYQYTSPPPTGFGVMSPGHDRPYRFSFYSNALSATIHARSLCELPAEGQSFEDLFSGLPSPSSATPRQGDATGPPAFAAPVPLPPSRPSILIPNGQRTPSNSEGMSTSYNGIFGRPAEKSDPGRPNGSGPSTSADAEANTWWLDIQSPTDEEMKVLSKVFCIHPLTTEDIQMEEAREKIELFRNYYLVCFRSFDQDLYSPTYLEPLNMYIIVFREGILSFHFRPTPHPQNVRRRIKQLKDYINVTSDWISYALIDDITDAFGPLIQSIEYEVDSIDELVLILKEAEQSDMLRRIGMCRKKVMGLLRLMGNKADVVKGLAKRCNENWRVAPTSDIGLYLSDIQDHLITMTQNLNHYEKILSRSHSNYLAQISIEMTDANNQINDVLSKLTALGTVLVPMNLITGLWGMNVHVPGQDIAEGYAWFSSIVAALAAFALIGGYTTYRFMVRR